MVFVAPLDAIMWDRRAVRRIFGFDYVWEVYKPAASRRWGYYVLPVIDGDRLVARLDGRVAHRRWQLTGWWWEKGVRPSRRRRERLQVALRRTAAFLGVEGVSAQAGVPREVADVAEVA